jgi:hypothetical protein
MLLFSADATIFSKNKPERVFGFQVRCREFLGIGIFSKLGFFEKFFGNFLDFLGNFLGFIFLRFFWRTFLEDFFCEDFYEEFFWRIFLEDFFWEEFFVKVG